MKKGLFFAAVVILSIYLGNLIGTLFLEFPELSILGENIEIGFSQFDLNLHLFVLTLGLQMKFNLMEIIIMVIAILVYPTLEKKVFG